MKRLIFFSLMCLAALTMNAQRCAVFQFNTGAGVTREDVDGIFYIFNSNFFPSGYQVLERDRIDRTIDNLGYGRTGMTLQQMRKAGRSLNASIIVVGEMNVFMDEYNIDVRVVDVATGATVCSESTSFERTSYRDSMRRVALRLARKVGIE